jgi:hypothetical protein
MTKPRAAQSRADAHRNQQVHCSLFEHARSDAVDHVLAAAVLDDDRIDAVQMQQMSEQQPCRPCADDSDLCSQA